MTVRILLAEDIDIIRQSIACQLSREDDFDVIYSATSGKEAYSKAIELHPDVVIMDMEMEALDSGIVASKRIIEELPDVRIIILTVHEEDELVLDAFESGIADYVIKEPNCDNLINHIRKAVENKTVFDSKINKVLHNEFLKLRKEKSEINNLYRTFIMLTPAEREILRLLYDGKTVKEIASLRYVELITIKKQVTNILRKFGMRRTKEIVSLIKDIHAEDLIFQEHI